MAIINQLTPSLKSLFMNKFYLFVFLFFGFVSESGAQILVSEGFEGSTFPPAGWTRINASTTGGRNWFATDDAGLERPDYPPRTGSKAMVYEYSGTSAANAWMITPSLNLTAGKSYTIGFYYRVASASFPEKMKVTIGTANTVAAQTTTLWDNNGAATLTNNVYALGTTTYTPTATGNYFVGFNCYSAADQYVLLVDDITIEATAAAAPSCVTNSSPANGATNVNVYPLTLTWNASSTATSYDVYAGTTNPPTTLITNTTGTTIRLTGGATNTTYYYYVVPRNSAGAATGCNTNSTGFTTQPPPPVPANDECTAAINLGTTPINASTVSATQSMAADSCAGALGKANDDIWYKITALSNGNATVSLTNVYIAMDAVMQAYSGRCGGLTLIGCADQGFDGENETMTLTNLVAGQTYYVRVFGFDSTGTEGPFTITATGPALPITLANFRGERQGNKNVLHWTTETEQNNRGFELQRSANGVNFTTLFFVNSKAQNGNSSATLHYEVADTKPFGGNGYYRLKQVDKDSKSALSNIVLLKGLKSTSLMLSNIYPNPARSVLNIVLSAPAGFETNIIVTDLAGKTVLKKLYKVVSGDNNIVVGVEKLPAGSYLIKALCPDGCQTAVSKFVKQ